MAESHWAHASVLEQGSCKESRWLAGSSEDVMLGWRKQLQEATGSKSSS